MSYTIVIPARYGSSRFPGKVLAPLAGRPMIAHVIERARESAADTVVVAVDDSRVAEVCAAVGAEVEMTDASHPSGTDRIAEVAARRGWESGRVIVGLQGDEPATPPALLDRLAASLAEHVDADMATLCTPIRHEADYRDPARVKVVRDARGFALYFSRAPIPWRRDASGDDEEADASRGFPESFLHVGIYAYRHAFLGRYGALAQSAAEREEQLEQLRVLHHGGRIHVIEVPAAGGHGVDRPEDVAAAERALAALLGERG